MTALSARTAPVRLGMVDIFRLAVDGLRSRPLRVVLSALGIAIGIATLVLVTSIPASSQAALIERLSALGSNQLRIDPLPQSDKAVALPEKSAEMVERIGPVLSAAVVGNTHTTVRRSDRIDPNQTSGLAVLAASPDLLASISGEVRVGRFLNATVSSAPEVVLGAVAAERLGIVKLPPNRQPPRVFIDGRYFTVIGILAPNPLATDIERSVLVGWDAAAAQLGFDKHPTVVYVTAREDSIGQLRQILAATVSPRSSGLVQVSRPSDLIASKETAQQTFDGLFIGLAGVALLVGGIGIANTMFISVLERRKEIGLRRALGATRRHISTQFLTEAVLLSSLGGVGGCVLGLIATVVYTGLQGWPPVIPLATIAAGMCGTLTVGVAAGIRPSMRAAALSPTWALAVP